MIQINDDDSPIKAAYKIIHGVKSVEMTPALAIGAILTTGKAPEKGDVFEADMFDDSEIMEIADYLLTYCKYHNDGGKTNDS